MGASEKVALKKLQIKNDNHGLDFFLSKELEIKFNHNENFIAWCIGSKHDNKKLSANKILEVCNAINYPIIFVGGSDDVEIADYILNQSSNKKIKKVSSIISNKAYLYEKIYNLHSTLKKDFNIKNPKINNISILKLFILKPCKVANIFQIEIKKIKKIVDINENMIVFLVLIYFFP